MTLLTRFFTTTLILSVATSVLAKSPTTLEVQPPRFQKPTINRQFNLKANYEYHVMVAEPVPEQVWVLEYREPGGEWSVYSTYRSEEALYDGIVWPALHLNVDLRHYIAYPEPEYELLAIAATQQEAQQLVDMSHAMGLWAYYVPRLLSFKQHKIR